MLNSSNNIMETGLNVLPPGVERYTVIGGGITGIQIFSDDEIEIIKQKSTKNTKVGDVLLFQSVTGNLDHVAVYIGDNMILNHNIKALSCREPFDLKYQQALRGVYRYAS